MARRLVWIQSKLRRYNPDVLHCTISGSGEDPSGHETKFAEDPSGYETEFTQDPPEVLRREWTRKSHYVAPPPVATNPEPQPIIKPVGER
jgi:hypothetical protein